jgi:hypothetical protein
MNCATFMAFSFDELEQAMEWATVDGIVSHPEGVMKQEALTKKKIELRKRITLGSGICNRVLS